MTEQDIFAKIPKPPIGSVFCLREVVKISDPHPYCITPEHLEYADSIYLDEAALERAEKKGARCDICKHQGKNLKYTQHKSNLTLVIEVPDNKDLNSIPGLHTYLLSIKELAESLGIQGFAFPDPKQWQAESAIS